MIRTFLLLSCLLVLTVCTGHSPDRAALERLALQRQDALNRQDPERYLALVSPNFRDGGKDFAAKRTELEGFLRSGTRVRYESANRRFTITGDEATMTGTYRMTVEIGGKELGFEGVETIRLRRESGGWKIVGGI